MTTDITELAQSLKAAAFNVKETAHIARYVKSTIARQTFKELMTPDNILALVEALEKAQQHIARQEQILLNQDESLYIRRGELEKAQAQSSKWLEAYHKAVSIGARYEERIAELESRTVKLPDDAEHDIMAPVAAYLSEKFKWDGRAVRWDGRNEYDALADRVKYALRMVIRRAAGIKVETE